MSTWKPHQPVRIGVQGGQAIVGQAAVRVIRRLVGADVGDQARLTTRGEVDERGEAGQFGDRRELTAAHRVVLQPHRDVRVPLSEDDIRGSGSPVAVGHRGRWQPRRDP